MTHYHQLPLEDTVTDLFYKLLRLSRDVNAVRRGKVAQRLVRRGYGKVTGRIAAKWLPR